VKRFDPSSFSMIGVSSDDAATLLSRKESMALPWPNIAEGSLWGANNSRWGISGHGQLFVVDQQGVIRARDLHGKELEGKVRELLQERRR